MLPPALAPPCNPPTPLSCVPHGDAGSVFLLPSGSPEVIPSSSVSDASEPPIASDGPPVARVVALPKAIPLAALSPVSVAAYLVLFLAPSPALCLRHCPPPHGCIPPPRLFLAVQPSCCVPVPSSLSGSPPPQSSPRPLRPLAPALAANIARSDEDVGDWTGGVVALRSVAGRSAPRGKSPSRPRAVVGDGISRPLLLHLPQQ